jgi:hypothetical protein
MPSSTGIYAAVNAIRLATSGHCRLSQRDLRGLIEMGWAWRCKRGEAAHSTGLRVGDWVRMVEALIFAAAHRHGQYLTVIRPWRETRPSKIEFLRTLERLLVSNHVVATLFAGAHFSVVRGYTPDSLLLFDSTGRTAIRRTALAMSTRDKATRHRVAASATLAIRRSN